MRVLYAARMARFDLLRAVNGLSCFVSYLDFDCDKRLCRLAAYIKYFLKHRQVGWVGISLSEVQPHTYADADFSGCPRTLRSTSGAQ